MKKGYFKRVFDLTGTRFWINNVTREEAGLAIAEGATGCTQNPSYTWKMLNHETEKDYTLKLLDESLKESDNDNDVESILQRKLIKGVSDIFLPVWEKTNGAHGWVSIQGDPIHEEDPQVIIDEGRKGRALNPNIMVKIPATSAGLAAMETLIAENTPVNATEVMGLSQALDICRMYKTISDKEGVNPKIYYSLITGIYDEYLFKYVSDNNIDISKDILFYAGLIIAKKVYTVTKAKYPEIGFIGGGVRGLHHFTEMVGADVCITMNWDGQATDLLKNDYPVVPRFFNPVPDMYLDELLAKVPEFKRAWYEKGLSVNEYEHFGPVEYFRHIFVDAWEKSLKVISETRNNQVKN
jgi:transaldolase